MQSWFFTFHRSWKWNVMHYYIKFSRYAKLVFHISQVVKVKCLCFIILKISKICKVRFLHFTGREILCFITFKFSKICNRSRFTGREGQMLCFITAKDISKMFKVGFVTPNRSWKRKVMLYYNFNFLIFKDI